MAHLVDMQDDAPICANVLVSENWPKVMGNVRPCGANEEQPKEQIVIRSGGDEPEARTLREGFGLPCGERDKGRR